MKSQILSRKVMDVRDLIMWDFKLSSPCCLLVLLSVLFLVFFKRIISPYSNLKPLPPGPRPWPLLGNIVHVGQKPYLSLTRIARTHGPFISLRLGHQLLIVGSSPAAATAILKVHDRQLSGRFVPGIITLQGSDLERVSLIWASSCSDHWKLHRTLCRTELFSARAIQSQAKLREKKVSEMVDFLSANEGNVVNLGEIVFDTVLNSLSNLFFSMDFGDLGEERGSIKGLFQEMRELASTPNVADLYPFLGRLDLQGLRRKSLEFQYRAFGMWESEIRRRRELHGYGRTTEHCDFLDIMIRNGFSDGQINHLIMEFLSAGTDSTTTTIEWVMAELLKNREAMAEVQQELRREPDLSSVKESDLSKFQYLHACVKETFRLHPPAPFLLPHRATETCEVMNYRVPEGSLVMVNVWAIGRDPSIWEDPLLFRPERFFELDLDFKGHDFEFLPFGSGRRICPGLPLATKQVHLILAALIRWFNWFVPNNEDPSLLDMKEKFVISLQREQPLLLIPKHS